MYTGRRLKSHKRRNEGKEEWNKLDEKKKNIKTK